MSEKRFTCGNCDWSGPEAELGEVQDLLQRIEPGDTVPDGECPCCGALAFEVKPTAGPDAADVLARIIATVNEFEKTTQEAEYTDTGQAWEVFYLIRDIAEGKA